MGAFIMRSLFLSYVGLLLLFLIGHLPIVHHFVTRCGSKNGHQKVWTMCGSNMSQKIVNYSRFSSQHTIVGS